MRAPTHLGACMPYGDAPALLPVLTGAHAPPSVVCVQATKRRTKQKQTPTWGHGDALALLPVLNDHGCFALPSLTPQ